MTASVPHSTASRPRLWPLYLAALLSTFVFSLGTITAPQMKTALHADDGQSALMVGIFAAAFAAGIIFCGRLGDRYGRRRMFLIGTLALAAASLCVAGAWNSGTAIAARVLQGFAAAAMMPQILSMVQANTTGVGRAKAVGIYSAAAGLGTTAGQVIGGLLVSAGGPHWGWRLAFIVFALLSAVAGVSALKLPPDSGTTGLKTDPFGALLLLIGLGSLIVALSLGPKQGWPGDCFVLLGISVAAFVGLVCQQRGTERRGGHPLLPAAVLRTPALVLGALMALMFFGGYGAWTYNYALLTQAGRGDPAWLAALVMGTFCVAFFLVSLLCHRLVTRIGGPRTMLLGALGQGVGLLGIAAVSLLPDTHWEWWFQLPSLILGAGQALQFGPLVGTVMAEVPPRIGGLTGGLISTMQQTGIAVGVATIGAAYVALESALGPTRAFGVVNLGQLAMVAVFAISAAALARRGPRRARTSVDLS